MVCVVVYIPTIVHNASFNGSDASWILTGTAYSAKRLSARRGQSIAMGIIIFLSRMIRFRSPNEVILCDYRNLRLVYYG